MIVNNILNHIFANTSSVKVLRVLSERVTGISGRETSRLAGVSLRSTQIALQNFENLKIVTKLAGGRENSFSLNRNNRLVQTIITEIFKKEKEFKKKINEKIKNYLGNLSVSIILFGSAARAEENFASDYDICIVYNGSKQKLENKISELRQVLYDEFGITLAPLLLHKQTFTAEAKRNLPPVNSIVKEGKLIYGETIKRLANG